MTTVSQGEDIAIAEAAPSSSVKLQGLSVASLTTIVVAAAAMVATMPGRTHGLGQIAEPMMHDFGIDKIEFANINLWATLIGALFCFPAGKLIDRFGVRPVLTATMLALGLTVIVLARTKSLDVLYVVVMLTRGFGQSALSVISIALLGKAFDRRLAWPAAIYSMCMSIGFIAIFQVAGHYVKNPDVGWRGAWTGIGIALLVAASAAWLALRVCVECGESAQAYAAHKSADETGHSLFEALSTPIFWVLAAAISFFGLVSSGISLFNVGVLAERGFTFDDYLFIQAVCTPFGLVGQGLCGWAARRWTYQRLTSISMLLYSAGLAWLMNVRATSQLVCACIVLGISGGMITVVFFGVWNRLFGYRELGRIQGAAQMLTVVASAVGPLVFAVGHARYHSYMPLFYALASIVALLGIAAWFTPSPRTSSQI